MQNLKVQAANVQPAAFKIKEAAAYLGGVSLPTIRRLVKAGRLKRVTALRHLIITKASCDAFLEGGK